MTSKQHVDIFWLHLDNPTRQMERLHHILCTGIFQREGPTKKKNKSPD